MIVSSLSSPFLRRMSLFVMAAILLCGFGLPPAAADEPRVLPASNTALLARASGAAARRLVAGLPVAAGTKVGLRQEGTAALDADVREALLQALNAKKIQCVLLPSTADAAKEASAPAAAPATSDTTAGRPTGMPGGELDLAAMAAQAKTAPASAFDQLQAERAAQEARAESIRVARGAAPSATGTAAGAAPGAQAATAAVPAGLPVLTWRVQEARVDYVRQYRSGIFGAQRIERRARADLSLRLTPAGAEGVTWSAQADTSIGDVVPKSEIAALEDRTRPETKPQLPQSGGVKKIVEPVLVIILVAGLVSLFYQNRP